MVTSTQSGRGEAGGVGWQEKKGRQADPYNIRKRERNSKRQAFAINLLLLIIQSKKWTQQRPFNVLPGQKSQKTKIRTQDKKTAQHYFRWNWKPFQVAYIIGHEWDGMTHVHLCQLCQCLVCLARCQNSMQEQPSKSGQRSSKIILIGLSIFRRGREKIRPWKTFLGTHFVWL